MQVDIGKGHPLSGLGIFEADLIEIHRTVLYVINGVFRVMKSTALGQHLRDSFSRFLRHGDHYEHHGNHHQAHQDHKAVGQKGGKLSHIQINPPVR